MYIIDNILLGNYNYNFPIESTHPQRSTHGGSLELPNTISATYNLAVDTSSRLPCSAKLIKYQMDGGSFELPNKMSAYIAYSRAWDAVKRFALSSAYRQSISCKNDRIILSSFDEILFSVCVCMCGCGCGWCMYKYILIERIREIISKGIERERDRYTGHDILEGEIMCVCMFSVLCNIILAFRLRVLAYRYISLNLVIYLHHHGYILVLVFH